MSTDDDRALVERALAVSDQRLSEGMLYRHLAAAVLRLLAENERLRETEKLYDRLVPELAQRQNVIDAAAKHWLALEPGIAWEGGLDAAMAAACAEIEALREKYDELVAGASVGRMLAQAVIEIESLRADKERLDWLERFQLDTHDSSVEPWRLALRRHFYPNAPITMSLRAAIDAARER